MGGPRDQHTCACEHGGDERRDLVPLHFLLRYVAYGLWTTYVHSHRRIRLLVARAAHRAVFRHLPKYQ
ncbi:hypothetical protein MYA_5735 [Burkholderia sp. KJ006]|nr:hypothetical protein MYA_5735 [Burkholderia sp. KJ006]